MASKKQLSDAFARDPAKIFISEPEDNTAEPIDMPEGRPAIDDAEPISMYAKKAKPETKTRRLQLLVKPSLYQIIKAEADYLDLSVNELVNAILERHAGM